MILEVKHFQEYLILNRRDLKTIKAYSVDVELFMEFVKKPIYLIEEIDVEKYKEFLFNEGYQISSINRKMVALNLFMKYHNHNIKIHKEKVQMQNFLNNVIEFNEFNNIIEYAKLHNDYRAVALLSTMYYTGMRIFECLQLKINDIYKDSILIKGKGKKYRTVLIPNVLRDIWKLYLPYRVNKSEMLFTGERGAITTRYSNDIFKKYAMMAGVDISKAHNHNLRHLYCRRMIDNNVDIATVADLVGHVDINVTRRYLVKSKQQLLDIINKI